MLNISLYEQGNNYQTNKLVLDFIKMDNISLFLEFLTNNNIYIKVWNRQISVKYRMQLLRWYTYRL